MPDPALLPSCTNGLMVLNMYCCLCRLGKGSFRTTVQTRLVSRTLSTSSKTVFSQIGGSKSSGSRETVSHREERSKAWCRSLTVRRFAKHDEAACLIIASTQI